MKILGIDPGLHVSGYALLANSTRQLAVLHAGTITTDTHLPLPSRIAQIFADADALFREAQPDLLAVEELYAHYKHPRTAILMGHARAMFLLAAARCDIPVKHFAATRIKKSLTGNGRASKEQMQLAVQTQLALPDLPTPADVADALAIAMCCFNEISRETVLT